MTTPEPTTTDRLARIRALLAKAESTEYPHEAEAFTAKAQALMAQWGVDAAMLAADDPRANVVGDRIVHIPGPYSMGKLMLLFRICEAIGVRTVRRRAPGQGAQEMHLFGLASDLERADMLFTSLLLQGARFLKRDQADNWYVHASNPRGWTRDWQEGYAARVHERLKAAERTARQEAPATSAGGVSQALVFVRRDELVAAAVAEKYPRTRKGGGSRQVGAGYGAGQQSGSRADLGGARLGSGSGRALGR